MHYWGVWHGKEPFENFKSNVGRFMVEYGFQSYPELSTLKKVLPDSSLSLESSLMKMRQKSYIGNGLISKHIDRYFDSPQNFEEFVNLSQKTQSKALGMAIQTHLDNQPKCMGTLFWQLNDCWPGPSWSVIDYYGNKKEAYFTVKEKFSTSN
jgi:beta-mannosidase